jgi:steroid 5-alpha reductase family enzyme
MSKAPRFGRTASFGIVVVAYLVALAAAVWTVEAMADARPLVTVLAADLAATLVIFVFSIVLDNGSMYDAYWSVAPPCIAAYWLGHVTEASAVRQGVVTALVLAWAIRLTANWARGWPGLHHEDWRYEQLYATAPMPKWLVSLLGVHVFPTIQVYLGCLALVPALARGGAGPGVLDVAALLVTGGAIVLETVADRQMRAFARTKAPGDIMDRGVWAWSRHPNYLGELGFWWGLFLFGVAADPAAWWWTLSGPLAMACMFLFASIPLLDGRSVERRPGYAEYMQRVPALLPFPRRVRPGSSEGAAADT